MKVRNASQMWPWYATLAGVVGGRYSQLSGHPKVTKIATPHLRTNPLVDVHRTKYFKHYSHTSMAKLLCLVL